MLLALRFEPSRFFIKGKTLPLRKNLQGSKRKANNNYFAFFNLYLLQCILFYEFGTSFMLLHTSRIQIVDDT